MTKKGTTSTPHDAVFKQFLSHPECARDFIEIHLPASLRQLCNLQTLKLESGSFIEADLRASYSDVLWSLKTRDGDGYIHIVDRKKNIVISGGTGSGKPTLSS